MIKEIFMPQLGQTMEEGVINKWLKKEGEWVDKGEPILEIATDKANLEVESFHKGYLRKILYPEGATVPVTTVIALITDEPDEEIPEDYLKKKEEEKKEVVEEKKVEVRKEVKEEVKKEEVGRERRVKASPLAKRLAREKGVDLSKVTGTGPGGRITKEDVLKYLSGKEKEVVEFTPVREITARRMVESKRNIPHFYLEMEINMSRAKEIKEEKGVTYTAIILRALAISLRNHPWMRSYFEAGKVVTRDRIDINIAIDTPQGLYAPLIREVDRKSLERINEEVRKLADKAREGKLSPEDLELGVITLSNLGMFGIEKFSAIIVPGQSSILAVGRIKDEVRVIEGMIGIKPVMRVVLSCDHRVVGGAEGARFLKEFCDTLEKGEGLS